MSRKMRELIRKEVEQWVGITRNRDIERSARVWMEGYDAALTYCAERISALLARTEAGADGPIGWYTEDYRTDKSATTYDAIVAERWRSKGWPVWPLFTHPQDASGDVRKSVLDEMADNAAEIGLAYDDGAPEVMVSRVGDYKAIRRVMACVLFDDKKIAECYTDKDAQFVGAAIRAHVSHYDRDRERMDWLVTHAVEVREPMRHGSRSMFHAQSVNEDHEDYRTNLREQIDAAMQAKEAK